jgi:hypothetical protein
MKARFLYLIVKVYGSIGGVLAVYNEDLPVELMPQTLPESYAVSSQEIGIRGEAT